MVLVSNGLDQTSCRWVMLQQHVNCQLYHMRHYMALDILISAQAHTCSSCSHVCAVALKEGLAAILLGTSSTHHSESSICSHQTAPACCRDGAWPCAGRHLKQEGKIHSHGNLNSESCHQPQSQAGGSRVSSVHGRIICRLSLSLSHTSHHISNQVS